MNLAPAILGTTAVARLQENHDAPVLQIGSDRLTRGQLAAVACYNFVAARTLSQVLNKELRVRNLKHVFEEVPPEHLALPRIGVVSLAVLGAAFEAAGIGGDTPLESYVRRHAQSENGNEPHIVTFDTIKHREHQSAARERQGKGRRVRRRS